MEWIRYHPKVSAAVAAVLTLIVIVFVYKAIKPADHTSTTQATPDLPTPTYTPLKALPTASATPTPTTGAGAGSNNLPGFGSLSSSGGGGTAKGGSFNVPGYQGGSLYKFASKHKAVLRIYSDMPIGTIGWSLLYTDGPTSGTVKHVGTSWSMTRTVYGDPDYARLFFAAGATGSVHCTITIDGKVTEQRSTEGPYAQMMCQG